MPDSLPINDELRELFLKIICSPNATNNFPEIPNIRPVLKRTIEEMLKPGSPCRVPPATDESAAKAALVTSLNAGNNKYDSTLIEACWDFVDYQRDFCVKNQTTLATEGFQIGSPWHGDVINAPVLFLSINPAITHRCFFPRWHVQEDVFTFAGLNASGSPYYDLTDIHGRKIPNVISDEEIYGYLTNRFQDTPLTHETIDKKTGKKGGRNLAAIIVDDYYSCYPHRKEVRYWSGMKGAMSCLLGNGFTNIKRLMRSVLSAEIIFWGTKEEKNVNNSMPRLQYFWNSFVDPLLRNCGAKILFLVGATSTLQAFNTVTGNKLKNAKAMNWNLGGKNFAVAAMNNPAGQAGSNHVAAIAALKGLGDSQVQQAINKAQYMYNN